MEETKTEIKLVDLLKVLKKRIYIILPILMLALGCSVYYRTHMMKPEYMAKVSIIIGNVIDSDAQHFQINDIRGNEVYMQTYVKILQTNIVAERTIQALGLNISTDGFKNHYYAIPQSNTQFIEITVKWGSPEEARAILDTLSDVFIEEALRIYPTYTIKILEKIGPQLVGQIGDKLYYLLALSVSLFLSLAVVLILFYFDNTLESEDDIEKYLKVPVIGTIPRFRKKQGGFLKSIQDKKNISLDAYRTLRTNLYYISKQIDMKSIVITSANPKEGKSTASLMLAAVLAQGGKRTLLIDCDLRKPSLHKILNIENTGLSNILMDEYEWIDVVRESNIDNLFALPAGLKPADPTSLISSDRMMGLIGTLKEAFDFVVIDTPPVALVTDAQILSQCTEGYLIVVSSGTSVISDTVKALKLIQYAQGRIVGVLLNKVADFRIYRKYGYYYR